MTTSTRAGAIRASPAAAAAADASLAWRRAVLWALLGAKVVASWGVQWDIQWHTLIGRDSFWIAPHLMTYAGVAVMVGLSFGVRARTGRASSCVCLASRGRAASTWRRGGSR